VIAAMAYPGAWEGNADARHRTLYIAVLLIAVSLRLYGLGAHSLWYDEAASLYLGQHSVAPGVLMDAKLSPEPPLNPLLTRWWQALVDTTTGLAVTSPWHDFLLRLMPFFFGVAAVPLVYALTLRLFQDRTTALFAMALFAISPFQIRYAQELRVYSLYVLLALLAVWCMVRALEEGRRWQWAGMVAALAASMYAHFFSMWLIFTLNVAFVAMLWKYKHHFWRWTAANAVLMLLISPMLLRAFAMHAETQQIDIPWYPNPTWKTPLLTFKSFFAGFGPSAWAYWPLFLVALLLWVVGLRRHQDRGPAFIIVASLIWVPLFGCAWLWGRADFSFYEHRIFVFSGVAAAMGAAWGLATLGRFGVAGFTLIVLLTLPCLGNYYAGQLHPIKMHRLALWDKVDFRSAAAYMDEQWAAGDRLVYASHFSAYPMYHYYPHDQVRMGWDENDESMFIRTMGHEPILRAHKLMPIPKEKAVAGAKRIWFLSTEGTTFEWQPTTARLLEWLEENFVAKDESRFDGIVLRLFIPRK